MDQALINRIVEAALLAANQPLPLAQLHGLFPEDEPAPPGSIERALEQLREACAGRGVELVEVASGFRYQVNSEVHPWVARLWTERKTRYTRATLETLALIAYRQPITRGEIEQVRGVAVSSNIIQALEEREWIRVVGHRDVPGKPALFGTTKGFLDYFGLKRLDELPPLSELKDIGELEPQLQLDRATLPVGDMAQAGAADADAGAAKSAADADAADVPPAEASDEDNDTASDPETAPDPDAQAEADSAADSHAADDTAAAHRDTDTERDTDVDAATATASSPDTAPTGEPEAAPGERAADANEAEDNAVATTTVAVDDADSEPQAGAPRAGRSQVNE
ncbi:SMC-Scp complex subunit ScpB [Xanthomonas translucens]|uniref:Segregation and condensation protein B n=3 Tax=Xanthomonas campestris pv. translucens TaxID=343 RepID=A0A109HFL9_XANCT|nr:SMC-Scp complex subunit ScpB [Xanthomonas translucens]KWV11290.1 segregation and condensation protein B [Xanthomonas translucens]KWV13285.1 segregation and condensation protein B [Xanthomonas translucens]MCC8447627.1 SMC-Scp complex subunit ScpB [Xanthomonas translucens pv. translucens]MCS3360477.1 SMC-Scp complex subunit ScpB [Xanthomonas translucens pv. translucens]MCS3374269.1 SMC-Scp complex subunit ScpB [Xanthomonas translucens pv. translucens]